MRASYAVPRKLVEILKSFNEILLSKVFARKSTVINWFRHQILSSRAFDFSNYTTRNKFGTASHIVSNKEAQLPALLFTEFRGDRMIDVS
jgi:hypothetical protein